MTTDRRSEPMTMVVCGECGAEVHQDLCECHRCAKEGRPQWTSPKKKAAPPGPVFELKNDDPIEPRTMQATIVDRVDPDHEDWP